MLPGLRVRQKQGIIKRCPKLFRYQMLGKKKKEKNSGNYFG